MSKFPCNAVFPLEWRLRYCRVLRCCQCHRHSRHAASSICLSCLSGCWLTDCLTEKQHPSRGHSQHSGWICEMSNWGSFFCEARLKYNKIPVTVNFYGTYSLYLCECPSLQCLSITRPHFHSIGNPCSVLCISYPSGQCGGWLHAGLHPTTQGQQPTSLAAFRTPALSSRQSCTFTIYPTLSQYANQPTTSYSARCYWSELEMLLVLRHEKKCTYRNTR